MLNRDLINSKDIIIKIIIFFVTIFFLLFYFSIFKSNNIFIGITTIAIILMLFDRDMADKPLSTSLKLYVLNFMMLGAAFIIEFNPAVFLIINFILVFLIGYYFSSDLNKPLYIPFIFQYMFILNSPVIGNALILRIITLLIGPTIFLILQLIINKLYPMPKISISLISLSKLMIEKLNLLLNGGNLRVINQNINEMNEELRDILYEQEINGITSTKDCINNLNLSIAFERLSINIEKHNISKSMYQELIVILETINDFLRGNIKINRVTKLINQFIDNHQTKTTPKERLEVFNTINLMKERLPLLNKYEKKASNSSSPTVIKRLKLDQYFDFKSLSFAFALKLSVGLTIIYLISNIFNLAGNIWINLAFVINLKYVYEPKWKPSLIETVIGFILLSILVLLVNIFSISVVLLIVIAPIVIFIFNYISDSRVVLMANIILLIILGLMINLSTNNYLIMFYLLFGTILSVASNYFFFPFKLKDQSAELKRIFYEVVKDMMHEIYIKINSGSKSSAYYINSLYLTSSLILEQLATYHEEININDTNIQTSRRHLSADLYELYLISDRIADLKYIKKQFNYIFKTTDYKNLYSIRQDRQTKYTIEDKLAIILLNNIINELQDTNLKK